jgi:hypothetical protein
MSVLGFEPTYVPGQSYAPQLRLLLCLVRACAPETVPTMMARAIAVLMKVVSPSGSPLTPFLVLEPLQWWRPTG